MTPIRDKPLPDPSAFTPEKKPIRKERLDDDGKEIKTPDAKIEYKLAKDAMRK